MPDHRTAWTLALLFAVSGCGKHSATADVEGTLRLRSQPLGHCLIVFLPEPGQAEVGPHSTAVTDSAGRFRLRFLDQRPGASIGWHRVTVRDLKASTGIRRQDHGTGEREADPGPPQVRPPRFSPAYESEAQSPLRVEVGAGHQVIELELQ